MAGILVTSSPSNDCSRIAQHGNLDQADGLRDMTYPLGALDCNMCN